MINEERVCIHGKFNEGIESIIPTKLYNHIVLVEDIVYYIEETYII